MKNLISLNLKVILFSLLALGITNCTADDWLDIDFENCNFYSYIEISDTCECLENAQSNCSTKTLYIR